MEGAGGGEFLLLGEYVPCLYYFLYVYVFH